MCLDRIFIQAMISRPIVIAPVAGIILGQPYTGLMTGAILELFWMDRAPIGIYIPPNDSVTAAFAYLWPFLPEDLTARRGTR